MVKTLIQILSNTVVLVTVIDFIVDSIIGKNIVSGIRTMIRKTENFSEFLKSQKRVTYFSILCKSLSLCLLIFSALFLNLSWAELVLHMLAISIFIANITMLITKAIN